MQVSAGQVLAVSVAHSVASTSAVLVIPCGASPTGLRRRGSSLGHAGALRRARGMKQVLGTFDEYGEAAIPWATIRPWGNRYLVSLHVAEHADDEASDPHMCQAPQLTRPSR
jgi:hypothetical protein